MKFSQILWLPTPMLWYISMFSNEDHFYLERDSWGTHFAILGLRDMWGIHDVALENASNLHHISFQHVNNHIHVVMVRGFQPSRSILSERDTWGTHLVALRLPLLMHEIQLHLVTAYTHVIIHCCLKLSWSVRSREGHLGNTFCSSGVEGHVRDT